ncbi:MAG: hypothetical protein DRO23_05810 [Thermoprotei archaeon]|nr:MAG: hypothetical protein DRO23_05810 [Thermoprotei archaeon]
MRSKLTEEIKIKIGEKEISITEETLNILREYARTQMTLEKLAEKLGLESWEEAYELLKKIPAWLLWTPPTLTKIRKRTQP